MKMWTWAALGLGTGAAAYLLYRTTANRMEPSIRPPDSGSGALRAAGAFEAIGWGPVMEAAIEACPVTFDTGRAVVPPGASTLCRDVRDEINANPDLLAQGDALATADWSNLTLYTNPPMSGMSYPGLVWRWNG